MWREGFRHCRQREREGLGIVDIDQRDPQPMTQGEEKVAQLVPPIRQPLFGDPLYSMPCEDQPTHRAS